MDSQASGKIQRDGRMAARIAVTGSPGIGKSTLVERALRLYKGKAGGVLAREVRSGGRRVGFELLDLSSGEKGILAWETGEGPRLGRYRVNLTDLDKVGARAVENAFGCDLIVVDEVGPMELFSEKFVQAVEKAILSPKPMLVVLKEGSRNPLAVEIRNTFKVLTVTRGNRDALPEKIARELWE
jgi:nucleoside-triphosphatase